jgi:hypothetical protein
MELIDRIKAPTPKFWRKFRNTAGVIAGIAGALIVAPIALPVGVITALTYVAVVGGAVAGTAQLTKEDNAEGTR